MNTYKKLSVWKKSITLVTDVYRVTDTFPDVRIAYGSSAELETQLVIAQNLHFISPEDFGTVENQLIIVRKMLNKLMTSITKS